MIKDSSLMALKEQLSTDIIFFEEDGRDLILHFKEQISFKEFQENLESLYYDFAKEHSSNLRCLEHVNEMDLYFKMLINVFELLYSKIGMQPNFVSLYRNFIKGSNRHLKISGIRACVDELEQVIDYLQFQKKIIWMAIELTFCSMKESVYRGVTPKDHSLSWESIWLIFEPFKSRLIEDIGNIISINEKIQFIKKERKRIDSKLLKKGVDSYKPPISLFFDTFFITLNDMQLSFNENHPTNCSNIKWSGKIAEFIEIVLSFKLSGVIELKDGSLISRKELFRHFERFFNLPPINDLDSRIHKLKSRSNTNPFLDKLKKNCEDYLHDEE